LRVMPVVVGGMGGSSLLWNSSMSIMTGCRPARQRPAAKRYVCAALRHGEVQYARERRAARTTCSATWLTCSGTTI